MATVKKPKNKFPAWLIIVSVVAVGLLGGVLYMYLTKASIWGVGFEAEDGSIVSPATKIADGSASSGAATQFGGQAKTYRIIGSGDIAYTTSAAKATGDQIRNLSPAADAVFNIGDNAYQTGSADDYATKYDPHWGSFKSKTYPAPGNHEYKTSGASGYYNYFVATSTSIAGKTVDGRPDRGYYAWNIGNKWRFYSLNSEAYTDEANTWLAADLQANSSRTCQVAYWHKPPWSSSATHPTDGNFTRSTYFATLHRYKAELVMTGHNHHYERFYPMNPSGQRDDTNGLLSIVVGTGGADLYGFLSQIEANSAVRNNNTFGNLLIEANDNQSYKLSFLAAAGGNFSDAVTGNCR